MKRLSILMLTLVAAVLQGCATAPQKALNMAADPRTGTDFSPYRSIAPAIQCDDCRY